MLRISITDPANGQVTLQLDGQVSGRWVELLRTTCEGQLQTNARVAIDMKNVSFLDREGLALLRDLCRRRVEILNALPFIAGELERSGPGGDAQRDPQAGR